MIDRRLIKFLPQTGWSCVGTDDLGPGQFETCEWCGTAQIRYVHTMEHPRVSTPFRCGCICAGYLEGDLDAARTREASLRKRSARRKAWSRRTWVPALSGVSEMRTKEHVFRVYETGTGWVYAYASRRRWLRPSDFVRSSPYASEAAAKAGTFDVAVSAAPKARTSP